MPTHLTTEFHDRRNNVALLIGVLNEGDKFTTQLAGLQPYRNLVDIIVVDGGSTDGATAPEALASGTRTLLINTDTQRGLSVQYRIGLAYALQQGYAAVIMMDGNGKDGPEAIPRFIDALDNGAAFVQGSRFLPGGEHKHTPLSRLLGIRCVFNPLMYLACGFRYTDAMNGYKAITRELLLHADLQPFRDLFIRYNLQYYLNYRAPRLAPRIMEIPVSRNYRPDIRNHSKIVGISAWISIVRELVLTITGRYNP